MQLIILYWRDIPAQVSAVKGRRAQCKVSLEPRFAEAIDRAAMKGKAGDDDSYLQAWRKSQPIDIDGDPETAIQQTARQLEQQFDQPRLEALIKNGGFQPE